MQYTLVFDYRVLQAFVVTYFSPDPQSSTMTV